MATAVILAINGLHALLPRLLVVSFHAVDFSFLLCCGFTHFFLQLFFSPSLSLLFLTLLQTAVYSGYCQSEPVCGLLCLFRLQRLPSYLAQLGGEFAIGLQKHVNARGIGKVRQSGPVQPSHVYQPE